MLFVYIVLAGCQTTKRQTPSLVSDAYAIYQPQETAMLQPSSEIQSLSSHKHDPQHLAHAILSALLSHEALEELHLQLVSNNNIVLVVGEARNQEQIDLIYTIIKSYPDVKAVYSYLTIANNLPTESQIQDSMILTEARSKLTSVTPSQSHMQIIVNNDRIFLLGKPSKESQEALFRQLSLIPQVKNIYISP